MCVTSSVKNPTISDTRYPNLKCKDAIADRMSEKFGRRPDSGPLRDRAVIHLYWEDKDCSIYIDTSGEPLSKRRYRKIPFRAPMQETLAAAVIKATGWSGGGEFHKPHVRKRNTCHRGKPYCSEQAAGPSQRQLRLYAHKRI